MFLRELDCGAGIGRVTRKLLLKFFKQVDIVEQNPEFVQRALETLPKVYLKTLCICVFNYDTGPYR